MERETLTTERGTLTIKRRTIPALLLLPFLLAQTAGAQKLITGTVVDAQSGEPLPTATVQVVGMTLGATTNADGAFRLYLREIPAGLQVRFIGYNSAILTVDATTDMPLDIRLEPVRYELDELVVVDEDPALNIMRRVIARKQEWRDSLGSYRAEGYTRFMLYRRNDLVQMREHISEAYWQSDRGAVEFVRAERRTPEGSNNFRFAGPTYVPNFYDDNVRLMGMRFIGPTHPDALDAYTFRLGDRRMVDSSLVYVIYASPKNRFASTFVGRLTVLAEEYVLMDVFLRPSWFATLPPPIISRRAHYEQHFAPTPEGFRVPIDLTVEGSVSFGRLGVQYPTARYRQASRLAYHVAGWPVPDSLFAQNDRLVRDPFAPYQQFLFEGNPAEVPLTDDERSAMEGINPNLSLSGAFWPSGLLANYGAVRVSEPVDDPLIETERSLPWPRPWVWYNRVDGTQLGLIQHYYVSPSLSVSAGAGYTLKRKRPVYRANLSYRGPLASAAGGLSALLQAGIGEATATTYTSDAYTQTANAIGTYLGYDDYFDYYLNRSGALSAGLALGPVSLLGGVQVESHRSLEKTIEYDGWLLENDQRENPQIDEGRLSAVTARLEIGDLQHTRLVRSRPGLVVDIQHALPDFLEGDFRFTSISAAGFFEIETLFRRRATPSTLRIYGMATRLSGTPPPQRMATLDVSVGPLGPFGVFRSLDGLPPAGRKAGAVFWEHDFSTLPFELMGWRALVDRGTGLVLHGGHGHIWAAEESGVKSFTQHEMGGSIINPFGYPVRFDVTWDLATGGRRFTIGFVRVPQIRL